MNRLNRVHNDDQLKEKLTKCHYFVIAPKNDSCPYTEKSIQWLLDNGCNVIAMTVDHIRGDTNIPPYNMNYHPMVKRMGITLDQSSLPRGGVQFQGGSLPQTYPRIFYHDNRFKQYEWIGGSDSLADHLKEKFQGLLVGSGLECHKGCED